MRQAVSPAESQCWRGFQGILETCDGGMHTPLFISVFLEVYMYCIFCLLFYIKASIHAACSGRRCLSPNVSHISGQPGVGAA